MNGNKGAARPEVAPAGEAREVVVMTERLRPKHARIRVVAATRFGEKILDSTDRLQDSGAGRRKRWFQRYDKP